MREHTHAGGGAAALCGAARGGRGGEGVGLEGRGTRPDAHMAFGGGGGGGGPAGNGVSVQLEASSVLTVAESAGLSGYLLPSENGPPAAAERLAEDADFRLRELVQEAVKVMRHGRRTQLTAEDVSTAIRLLGCEPLYGYGTHGLFRQNERQRGDCTGGGPAGW